MPKNKSKPVAYTAEEVRAILRNHMRELCSYWATPTTLQMHRLAFPTEESRMQGLCHSILAALDGDTLLLPKINLVLDPHPTDKDYHTKKGEKYFKKGLVINPHPLHEEWH